MGAGNSQMTRKQSQGQSAPVKSPMSSGILRSNKKTSLKSQGHDLVNIMRKVYKDSDNKEQTAKVQVVTCPDTGEQMPQLTEEQRKMIVNSWGLIRTNLEQVGVMTFKSMFEIHPEAMEHFMPFKQLDSNQTEYMAILREHSLRAMNVVDKVCTRVHNQKQIDLVLDDLGRRHIGYKARPDLMQFIAEQFIFVIRPIMESTTESSGGWTLEAESAWRAFFFCMVWRMHRGMRLELKERNEVVDQAGRDLERLLQCSQTETSNGKVNNG